MASEGGGKLKQKRNQTPSKPYERRSSLFGKLKDSVKDLLIPSWLSGSPSVKQDEEQSGSTQRPSPHVDTPRPSGRVGPVAHDWSHGNTFQSDRLVPGPMTIPYGNSTSGKLSTNIPGFGLQTPNGELGTASSHSVTPAPNLTIGSHVHPVPSGSKPVPGLSKNEFTPDLESEDQRHTGTSEFQQIQEFEVTPIRPVMVSTGVHKSASAQPDVKRQRLWSPEPIRQGKPLVPPARGKPSFNTLLFGTPSKGDTSITANSFGDSSFYVGKTRYGGASSAKKAINTSLPYQSSLPLRKQVKATRLNSSFNATTSSTAQRILDTLERMSTPLEDAKKIPQAEQGNDSVLSFTPSSYRRQSAHVRPITRPLQLPNRGPPTSQLQNASQFDIARNRDRSKSFRPESESSLSITQETVSSKEDGNSSSFTTGMGKMKSKKFSQHISSRQEEEVTPVVPSLRTDFTLPAAGMAPITLSFGGTEKSSNTLQTAAAVSTKSDGVSPLKFTFSTPIEEKNRPCGSQVGSSMRGFKFSSPIHVSPNKTSAAGAEEGSKSSPEPAVGAATPQVSMWSSPQMVKPKAMSPDIGGTSSSFKSYTKWSGNQKSEASNVPPAFGLPGPATALKKGSVMDILGGGKSNVKETNSEDDTLRKKLNASEPSRSHGVTSDSNSQSNAIPLSALFKKPMGSWECDACMIQNTASVNKCIACATPKPGSKPTVAPPPPPPAVSNVDKPLSAMFKKPEGSWECGTCMVQNNASASKCVACTTPKPGSKSETSAPAQGNNIPLSALFKKAEGSWDCDTCMIQNSASALKCVACETPKPGAKSTMPSNKSNNSLAAMFKKPEGSWECDTCMVQNSSTALRCIACDSSKPGLQSAGIVSKPSLSANSQIEIGVSGGFSFNMPSTTTTTTGSAGFKFGNTTASVISSDAAPLSSGGFSFGHNSSKDSLSVKSSETKTAPLPGGFQFGALSSSTSVPSPPGGFQFGTSVTSSADSGSKVGFTFNSSSRPVTLPSSQSLSTVSPSSTVSFTSSNNTDVSKSSTAVVTGGFQFGSGVPAPSATVAVDKKSEASAPSQPTFTIGATPAISTQASPFVFGAPLSSAPPSNIGLGMGQSLATPAPSVAPLVNGVFGASSNSGSGGFAFGTKHPTTESSSSQISSTTKRSIDSTGFKGPSAKISPVFGSVSKEPSVNGGFNFNGGTVGQSPFSSNASSAAFTFGSNEPSQPPSTGGFQFSVAPASQPDPPPAVTGFSFATNTQSGQDSQGTKKGEVSFSVAPNFNFTGTSAPDGNATASVFQFGSKAPEAPSSNLFAFGSSNPSLSQPAAPVFGAPAGTAGLGTFSMGSADTSHRKMKKAVRRINKPR